MESEEKSIPNNNLSLYDLDLTCTGILKQPPIGSTVISDKLTEFRIKINTKSNNTDNYDFELTEDGRTAPKQSLNSNFSNSAHSWKVKVDELEIYLTDTVREENAQWRWIIDRNTGKFASVRGGINGPFYGTVTGKCIKTSNIDKERQKLIKNRKF
jgi:hypothetical protein